MDIERDEQIGSLMAARLKQAREAAGLTQVQVVEKTGINRNSIINYEKPTTPDYGSHACMVMEARNLRKLASLYNVSTDYLLGLTDTRSRSADMQTACEVTGLSEESIKMIREINASKHLLGDYANELLVDFIEFAHSKKKSADYSGFRVGVNAHSARTEAWDKLNNFEKEKEISRQLVISTEAIKRYITPIRPDDAAKFYLAEFCDNLKHFLKNKYQLEVTKNGND